MFLGFGLTFKKGQNFRTLSDLCPASCFLWPTVIDAFLIYKPSRDTIMLKVCFVSGSMATGSYAPHGAIDNTGYVQTGEEDQNDAVAIDLPSGTLRVCSS